MPVEEPVDKEEAGKDAEVGEALPTKELVPEQVLVLPATLLVAIGI